MLRVEIKADVVGSRENSDLEVFVEDRRSDAWSRNSVSLISPGTGLSSATVMIDPLAQRIVILPREQQAVILDSDQRAAIAVAPEPSHTEKLADESVGTDEANVTTSEPAKPEDLKPVMTPQPSPAVAPLTATEPTQQPTPTPAPQPSKPLSPEAAAALGIAKK